MRRYFRTVLWILSAGFTLIVAALRADIVAIPAPLVEAPPPAPPIVSRAVPPADQMTGATPKGTVLYSIGQPTDEEQLYLEYINRARTNPPVEAVWLANLTDPDVRAAYAGFGVDTNLLVSQFNSITAAPPLSFNANLILAARRHSGDMFTNMFQGHDGTDGSDPGDRITAAGYTWQTYGENVYASAESVLYGHAGFNVDWGPGPGGMQTPPGHRTSIHNANFREVGIGVVLGNNGTVGPQLVTQDFGARFNPSPIVTGVVYYDFNGNAFYDLGEGIGGVRVDINGVTAYAISANSGGYSVPVNGNGAQTVIFSFDGQTLTQRVATVSGSSNVKLDFVPPYAPPQISGPTSAAIGGNNNYSFNAVLGATNYQWRSATRVSLTAVEGAESGTNNVTIVSSPGYNVIDTTVVNSGSRSFHFAHPSPPMDQMLTLKRLLRPGTNSHVRYAGRLRFATSNQVARTQISTNGGVSWIELSSQAGTGTSGESVFRMRTNSLAAYAGREVQVRFVYDYVGGSFFNQTDPTTGWYIDDIAFANTEELVNLATNSTASNTNFVFSPASTSNYVLQAGAQLPGRTLPFGPAFLVSGVVGPPVIQLSLLPTATNMLLRWPTNPPGFSLQATRTVALTNSWTNVPGAPVVSGTNYQLGVARTNSALFLRLRKP